MEKILKQIAAALLVLILILLFHYIGWLRPVESKIVKVLMPIHERVYSISLSGKSFYQNWLSYRDLLAENESLKQQLIVRQLDESELNRLKAENDLLKQKLNFVNESLMQFVSAKIITGIIDSSSQAVIIDKGSSDGIKKGMAVAVGEGVLVGKVNEVYADFSKVLLLIDNNSLVAATIQNFDQTVGLVEGQNGLTFAMTNIPKDQEVKSGDLVVTSGLEGLVPKNLLIAEIDSVQMNENEIFKTANLKPITSFNNLSYVLVVVPSNEL